MIPATAAISNFGKRRGAELGLIDSERRLAGHDYILGVFRCVDDLGLNAYAGSATVPTRAETSVKTDARRALSPTSARPALRAVGLIPRSTRDWNEQRHRLRGLWCGRSERKRYPRAFLSPRRFTLLVIQFV